MSLGTQTKPWDVLVVGGGHAGCEASLAASRLGFKTLLVTGSIDRIAAMSCNPAVGGVGKGHIVKELDILGGDMGIVADATGIQFRTLNASRGPAVQATRCQSDMRAYQATMAARIVSQENLSVHQDDVIGLVNAGANVQGVQTRFGGNIHARQTIITTGTFLGGKLHLGQDKRPGGRAGEAPASGLSKALTGLGLELGRLKTGTCPRLDGRTINWAVLEEQLPETPAPRFTFESTPPPLKQISCFMTKTTSQTHDVIYDAIHSGDAPVYNGQIDGTGPRYCPSIEDKVVRFRAKNSHLIFLEPQGLHTPEVYPNGLSTSLAPSDQIKFLRTIPGLEETQVTRWGYAVEYDFLNPTQLDSTLKVKSLSGLYTAGQINGTTGYEEAAVQGFLAGVNAARALQEKDPFILTRQEAYGGVLVDDLVTQGTKEPYRMFTSRAEHRLILREDNVHTRLYDAAKKIGIVSEDRLRSFERFEEAVQRNLAHARSTTLSPSDSLNAYLEELGEQPMRQGATLEKVLRRPKVEASRLGVEWPSAPFLSAGDSSEHLESKILKRTTIEVKYAGYIERASDAIAREKVLEDAVIPENLFESQLAGMSNEVFDKLSTLRPKTLGQASRISGVTPAAIGLLSVHIARKQEHTNQVNEDTRR